MPVMLFEDVLKFNPYHDSRGRFASGPGGSAAGGHLPHMSEREAVEYTVKVCGVKPGKAEYMVEAVAQYTQGYANDMRYWQRTGKGTWFMDEYLLSEMSAELETFIEKSPKWSGGELYRGIKVKQDVAQKIVAGAGNNQVMDMRGTSSWSSNKKIAEDFSKGVLGQGEGDCSIVFRTAGTKQGVSVEHISAYRGQNEVVVSRNAKWRGQKVTQTGENSWLIDLEEIG